MKTGYIYMIINRINGKKYIGQTINFNYRRKRHFRDLRKQRHYNKYLQNSFNKYGEDFFNIKIIEENVKKENLSQKEMYWIDFFDTYNGEGYNLTPGGEKVYGEYNPMHGVSLSEEEHGMYGKTHSQESRRKISKNHADVSGKNNPMYGTKRPDVKERVSGINNPQAKITKEEGIKIYNEYNNGCLYQYEIAEKYNTTQSVISRIVNNKHWTTENLNV